MTDENKTQNELEQGLEQLRQQVTNVEKLESERKRAQQALSDSEIRYRRLFETAEDGILILDAETGMITDVNPFLIAMLGFSHEEFCGKKIWEIGFFKDVFQNKANFLELQQKEYVRYEDMALETVDKRRIEVEFVSNVYLVNQQKVIQCNIRDISKRREIENGLEKARKELAATKISEDAAREYAESIINTVREPLIVLDQKLRVVTASRSFYDVFKVKPEDTVGQLIYDLGNKQWDIPKLRELLETILPQKTTFDNYEVEHDFAIIGRRIMLLNARQIQRVLGKERIILLAIEDITERKQAEEKTLKFTKELAAAYKELEGFSYSISHDLRAPLRAIQGFANILHEEYSNKLDSEGQRYLNIISTNTKQMGKLIDDILDLSRLGRKEIITARINMKELAGTIFNEIKSLEPDRRLELNLKVIPPIQGDKTLIRQALMNLVSNSIKFTKPREIGIIEIGGNESDNEIIYYVKDNGVGFDMKYSNKLFGVFQRLHSTEDFEGTGIGLAIVQRVINRHGGRVWGEGKTGEGATFYFSLPKDVNRES